MTNNKTQTVEQIIGTHEQLQTRLAGLQKQYAEIENWSSRSVDLLVDLNGILIEFTGHPSQRINQILDTYFDITATKPGEIDGE